MFSDFQNQPNGQSTEYLVVAADQNGNVKNPLYDTSKNVIERNER